ncbi:MAG: glycosyltransferase family 39 protein, partial [bacterium]|nr:glycosyltransferase family 39 protein [bacterium]
MRHTTWFLILAGIYLLGFILHALYLEKTVYGDGIFYYSWLRSEVIDDDRDFRNDYAYFDVSQPLTQLGIPGNKYSIGPALAWSPSFLWVNAIVRGNGTEFPYQFTIGLTSVLYVIAGLVLLYRLLTKYFSRRNAVLATLATAFATNLLFYGSLDPVNSHSISFFASTVFLSLALEADTYNWIVIGLALGFLGLIRNQDIIFGILLLPYLTPKRLFLAGLGLMLLAVPQLLAVQSVYGTAFVQPYLAGGEGFHLFSPHIIGVLFSKENGLFLWTPAVLLGCVGLFLRQNKLAYPAGLFLMIFLTELLIVSTWSTWWQGASFSGRMFVSSLPLFAFGMGAVFSIKLQPALPRGITTSI